jgi:ribosomal protein L11 methylase PrmA
MNDLHLKLRDGGLILMSGLLTEDREVIVNAAAVAGFRLMKSSENTNWIALLFKK